MSHVVGAGRVVGGGGPRTKTPRPVPVPGHGDSGEPSRSTRASAAAAGPPPHRPRCPGPMAATDRFRASGLVVADPSGGRGSTGSEAPGSLAVSGDGRHGLRQSPRARPARPARRFWAPAGPTPGVRLRFFEGTHTEPRTRVGPPNPASAGDGRWWICGRAPDRRHEEAPPSVARVPKRCGTVTRGCARPCSGSTVKYRKAFPPARW